MVSRYASLALTATVFAGISGATSLSQTYMGTLSNQASVVTKNFTLTSPSDVTIYTTSYGGGTNLAGTATSAGGFQPSLVLFDSAGNYVASEVTAGISPIANSDPSNGWAAEHVGNIGLEVARLAIKTAPALDSVDILPPPSGSLFLSVDTSTGLTAVRSPGQVLFLVYGGNGNSVSGGFFPTGVNGTINTSSNSAA